MLATMDKTYGWCALTMELTSTSLAGATNWDGINVSDKSTAYMHQNGYTLEHRCWTSYVENLDDVHYEGSRTSCIWAKMIAWCCSSPAQITLSPATPIPNPKTWNAHYIHSAALGVRLSVIGVGTADACTMLKGERTPELFWSLGTPASEEWRWWWW